MNYGSKKNIHLSGIVPAPFKGQGRCDTEIGALYFIY